MLHFGMNMPYYLMALYGSIMIVMVFILRTLLKNKLPKFVFPALWGIVLLRFLVPFSISTPLSIPVPVNPYVLNETGAFDRVVDVVELVEDKGMMASEIKSPPGTVYAVREQEAIFSPVETTVTYDFTPFVWEYIIPVAYILGIFITAGILGWQKYGYVKRLQNGLLVEHNETINTILRSMDMGHVLVFTCDRIATPLVCGLLNPRIYLPTQMDFQNTVLLRYVLVHETMHIRRRDNWMKGILLIVLCLNWYNPLVWIMAICLASDLECACDAAVLKTCGEEERKDYASSLLAMALTGRRTTLLYSAFSKTEVEKRVRNILRYKKMTIAVLMFTVLFLTGSMMAFAAVGQAPFLESLTALCGSDSSRWSVKVTLSRDIALGEKAQERAERVIFAILKMDNTNDPKVIEDRIRAALAEEFGVEKGAFHIMLQLCPSREELEEEYAAWGITPEESGFWMYQKEQIRIYEDKMLGSYQSRVEGTVDISVQRDELGEIISIAVWRQGDSEYDAHTAKMEQYRQYQYETETTENIAFDTVYNFDSVYDGYEYYLTKEALIANIYLTKEALIADIEQGYIFKLDTTLTKPVVPYVSQGNWSFYVHEENTVNLNIAFSDLLVKPNKNIFPEGEHERIIVEVISPEGQSAYRFEKVGDEITEDTSIQEQISVTPGEWKLQISFAYICGETPAHLRIAAAYDNPSEEDITWLKTDRLK